MSFKDLFRKCSDVGTKQDLGMSGWAITELLFGCDIIKGLTLTCDKVYLFGYFEISLNGKEDRGKELG